VSELSLLQNAVWVIVTCLLVLPVIPIGMSWHRVAKALRNGAGATRTMLLVLIFVSCSQLLLMLGLMAAGFIGPHYSSRRFATILVNIFAMAAATALAFATRSRVRPVLVTSSSWVMCSWLYLAAVSSVV